MAGGRSRRRQEHFRGCVSCIEIETLAQLSAYRLTNRRTCLPTYLLTYLLAYRCDGDERVVNVRLWLLLDPALPNPDSSKNTDESTLIRIL